jgi:hypothetical protein
MTSSAATSEPDTWSKLGLGLVTRKKPSDLLHSQIRCGALRSYGLP